MKLETIVQHLEEHEEDRPIAQKNKIIREYLMQHHPLLKWLGSDDSIEAMIHECLDIDRKIRLAKQRHPHLVGDTEEEKQEMEDRALEALGYKTP